VHQHAEGLRDNMDEATAPEWVDAFHEFSWVLQVRGCGQLFGNEKPQGLLRLGFGRGGAEDSGVELVARDLAVQLGLDFSAAPGRDVTLGLPFLDGLWRSTQQSAESGLIAGDADSFSDSGFHKVGLL
jgi:hypothetical protein